MRYAILIVLGGLIALLVLSVATTADAQPRPQRRFNFECTGVLKPTGALLLEYSAYTFKSGEVFVKCAAIKNGEEDESVRLFPPGTVGTESAKCVLSIDGGLLIFTASGGLPTFTISEVGASGARLSSEPKALEGCEHAPLR